MATVNGFGLIKSATYTGDVVSSVVQNRAPGKALLLKLNVTTRTSGNISGFELYTPFSGIAAPGYKFFQVTGLTINAAGQTAWLISPRSHTDWSGAYNLPLPGEFQVKMKLANSPSLVFTLEGEWVFI